MTKSLIDTIVRRILDQDPSACLCLSEKREELDKETLITRFMEQEEAERLSLLRTNLRSIITQYPASLLYSIWWNSPLGIDDVSSRLDLVAECELPVVEIDDFLPDCTFDIQSEAVNVLADAMISKIEDEYLIYEQQNSNFVHIKHEELKETFDSLINLTATYKGSKRFLKFLNFTTKIKNYSAFNVALIHAQNPNAEYVATQTDWAKKHNRKVKPNARPMIILAPFHPILMVFDINDTHGEPLPNRCFAAFWAEGYQPYEELEKLAVYLVKLGVEVSYEGLDKNLAGCISRRKDKQPEYRIVINKNHDISVKFATVIHELGHWLCGHLGQCKGVPDRNFLGIDQREFEAESVSFVVCKRFGIRSNSEEYLAEYVEKNSLIPTEVSIDLILKAASKIETIIRSGKGNSNNASIPSGNAHQSSQLGFEL